jgi:AraC-like DNA-binding protein
MKYQISKPSIFLSKYVKQYWAIENSMPAGKEHVQRIIPSGLTDLIFYLKDKPESSRKNNPIIENTLISGQTNGYYDLKVSGDLSLFSIIFQPHGLSMFFNIPSNELLNQNVPLRYILKDVVNELEDKLYNAKSFLERILIAEQFLLQLFRKTKKKYNFNRIEASIHQINKTKGKISIEDLASKACYSRKQYERTFSNFIGISPKKFLRIVRFQNAINEKAKNESINLTELTYLCNYYDQSHMNNDFAKLSGKTPKQYFNDCEPYSDYFQQVL